MSRSVKISVVVENTVRKNSLWAEHGLCFLIEVDGQKLFYDVGATSLLVRNIEELQLPLEQINKVVLSHGHYDHSGGLQYLTNKQVYAHPDVFIQKYIKINDEYIAAGMMQERSYYERECAHVFHDVIECLDLGANICLHVGFKKRAINNFFLKHAGEYVHDTFEDEVALSVNTPRGLIIVTGCSHSGVLNIIEKVLQDCGDNKIYALLGGMHLFGLPDAEVQLVAQQLERYDINKIGISHCTGNRLAMFLPSQRVFDFNVGDVLSI